MPLLQETGQMKTTGIWPDFSCHEICFVIEYPTTGYSGAQKIRRSNERRMVVSFKPSDFDEKWTQVRSGIAMSK
jgi:hypothetical protein